MQRRKIALFLQRRGFAYETILKSMEYGPSSRVSGAGRGSRARIELIDKVVQAGYARDAS